MVDKYNAYMGWVDKGDQLMSYYGFSHRTVKQWRHASFQIQKPEPGYDPLYKLQPFVDPLRANFKAASTLGQELSMDEGMIGVNCRLCSGTCQESGA